MTLDLHSQPYLLCPPSASIFFKALPFPLHHTTLIQSYLLLMPPNTMIPI